VLDTTRHRAILAARFIAATGRYWLGTYPTMRREIRRMRRNAARIPDTTLRATALGVLDSKWGDLEGAGAFAAFAPIRLRSCIARLLVCLQGIYDYADTLAEQPSDDPQADAITLHTALLDALWPEVPLADYYANHPRHNDGGYLATLVRRCRAGVAQLPTYPVVAPAAREHARRIVDYQARINHQSVSEHAAFASWATTETPKGTGLSWWETGAACGSSLALLALIAAAADRRLTAGEAASIEAVYWPWAGALHTLLDNLIDRAEDHATHQHNLTDHYANPDELAERIGALARTSIEHSRAVAPHHRLILTGMTALYLSDEQAWTEHARPASERIIAANGAITRPALWLLHARRLALKRAIASEKAPAR
jgi:tetraprenyl-beta-curcumene synthase